MQGEQVVPEFLHPTELQALSGLRQTAAIRRWLERAGVRFVTAPDGRPLVYRDGLRPGTHAPPAAPINLNLGALTRRGKGKR